MFLVCHILQSIDGRIAGSFFGAENNAEAFKQYGSLRSFYDCEATLYGTTTMEEFIGERKDFKLIDPKKREDHIIKAERYTIAFDAKGRLDYKSGTLERHGSSSQIIAVLSETVSDETLSLLKEKGVSYIFAGENTIDPITAVKKLEEKFGIEKMMIAGGGYIDWAFVKEDLVDELSIVIAPSADGYKGSPSLFMKKEDDGVNKSFELIDAQVTGKDTLWIRYRPIR